jgi:GntR family transcriptional regulator
MIEAARTETTWIDRDSPVPLHEQCRQLILNQIRQGELRPGDALPPERSLCEAHGLSRTTVRLAVLDLVQRGILQRVQGRGTFVTKRASPLDLHHLTSFSEDMRARGRTPSAKVLFADLITPAASVASALNATGEVMYLKRLRYADAQVMGFHDTFLPEAYRLTEADLEQEGSLHTLLARRYHLVLSTADETLEAGAATPEEAAHLKVPAGSPVLRIERLSYDAMGEPKEFCAMCYRADQYQYFARLVRR